MKRCPECNGKAVPLAKQIVAELGRNDFKNLTTIQFFRCKRCKKEFQN